jgi:hypothetical protein
MAKLDPQILAHLEWIGFVQPTGLVVSAPALVRAGAILEQRDAEGQRRLRACVGVGERDDGDATPGIPDFRDFAQSVLGWRFSPRGYAGTPEVPIPPELEVALPDLGETLRPDFAVRELDPLPGAPAWQVLVRVLPPGQDPDDEGAEGGRLALSAHGRMERLLRQTGVAAGLIVNGHKLRLVSAPRGESSGWLDFRVADMLPTAGRPIVAALRLLLSEQRLLALPRPQRLAALLADSRRFQNEVSEQLAGQVLHALYELLRGFQAAHDASKEELLREALSDTPDDVYRALLTVILRLVFLLYAEERDMLPGDETFIRGYSLAGLHARLRADAALHPDTMDQRFGAWAQLLALFRMVHDGAAADGLSLPPRQGVLFDPDRFPFLEGRKAAGARQRHARIAPPLVPDGTIYRALEKLLVLEGERISYRALDVEEIGSVYETMMGFRLEAATGRSVAIKAAKRSGAPTTIDLDALLAEPGAKRAAWLQERCDRKPSDRVRKAIGAAAGIEDLHAALQPMIDAAATPDLVPRGAMVLQPSAARRRSGSHYTPRELTEPIVRTTLEPIWRRLGEVQGGIPRPEAILDLKVCDPAMGSGAFLVEACRQLGDALVASWRVHGGRPAIPPDEDEAIFARRLVAQRCLYGVDRNPMAVDLAKMSLWLATLARDHALTFVDHALRHGDSLVGLSRRQLEAFHWDGAAPRFQRGFEAVRAREHLARVTALRQQIRDADDTVPDSDLRDLWDAAEAELDEVRFLGDLVLAAFFDGETPKAREANRTSLADALVTGGAARWRQDLAERRVADIPLAPFHWEIEFPEVFDRANPGFDAFVGNPPFVGGRKLRGSTSDAYFDWLGTAFSETSGNADLSAYFFRFTFSALRERGTLGLIATNTIAQGDTRSSGLHWICTHGGEIFAARRRVPWPGEAAVVVSVVHVVRGAFAGPRELDGRAVPVITAFLFDRGGHADPAKLMANAGKSFQGSIVLGMGFTFDDTDAKGVATPISEMHRIVAANPACREVIFPYIGGEEVNTSPTHAHHRYVISFGDRSEEECRKQWPELIRVLEEKVRPERTRKDKNGNFVLREPLPTRWWHHADKRPALYATLVDMSEVIVTPSSAATHHTFSFASSKSIFSHKLIVIAEEKMHVFSALQSRVHEIWRRKFGATLGDALTYNPSDVFETYPFPDSSLHKTTETAGQVYCDFRAGLMVRNNEGLTKTYNRFHDPEERDPDIARLRALHAAMDRAVLDAYGWHDLDPACEFLLDYEIDEEAWGDRKKPYRYRWPDEVQSEVLARLLELNAERARAEALAGATRPKAAPRKTSPKRTTPTPNPGDLFS